MARVGILVIAFTLLTIGATAEAGTTPSPTPVISGGAPASTSTTIETPTSTPSSSDSTLPQPRKILSGWIPYYSMKSALPSAMLNADLISSVSPFWYSLRDQNTIHDLYTPANPTTPLTIPLQSMQAAGFKVLPTITDGTNIDPKTGKSSQMVLSNLLANTTSRTNVVNAILNLVVSNKFDGIDLDFENFAFTDPISTWATTEPRWVQFLTDLSSALHAQGKLLSITTPPLFDPSSGKKGYYVYAWSQVASLIDQLHIMAYDYSTTSPGPIGPLPWTTSAVTYAASVVPASKVFIGIPGYGRDWVTKVVGTCPSLPIDFTKTVYPGILSTVVMHNVASLAAAYGATPTYNQTLAESSFTYQKVYNGTTANGSLTTCTAYRTVWYQDAQSFRARANLVSQFRLGGLSEWTFGMEDPTAFQAIREVALSIAPDAISSQLSADSLNVPFGAPTQVLGTFTLPDKTPAAGLPVHLQSQVSGGAWVTVADGTTAADGTFKATVQLSQSSKLRMYTDASWQRLEGDTAPLSIAVSRILTWNLSASMKAGVPYVITGQVLPAQAGVKVALNNGASGVTDATGAVKITVNNSTTGFIPFQLSIAADSNFGAVQSGFVTVWVR